MNTGISFGKCFCVFVQFFQHQLSGGADSVCLLTRCYLHHVPTRNLNRPHTHTPPLRPACVTPPGPVNQLTVRRQDEVLIDIDGPV